MSARQQERERSGHLRNTADWIGNLSRTDIIAGDLRCTATGWRLKLTGTSGGKGVVYLTAQFDSPVMSDDAAPWIDEHEMIKPHEAGQKSASSDNGGGNDGASFSADCCSQAHVAPSVTVIGSGQASEPYDCFWTGGITATGDAWTGELGDRYGGRLVLTGKTQREGVVSLKATAHMAQKCGDERPASQFTPYQQRSLGIEDG